MPFSLHARLSKLSADPDPAKLEELKGIKGATVGTPLYPMPGVGKRIRRLALDLALTLHELLMRRLDRQLAENGNVRSRGTNRGIRPYTPSVGYPRRSAR